MNGSDDPTTVRVLAVTVEDVVTALELNLTTGRQAVLRVTPPFSGRMRARLHVVDTPSGGHDEGDDTDSGRAPAEDAIVHVDPEQLLENEFPSYPTPAETEDELRTDPDVSYSVERHHERHLDAVATWREQVAGTIQSHATIRTPAGPHEVDITTLGDVPTTER